MGKLNTSSVIRVAYSEVDIVDYNLIHTLVAWWSLTCSAGIYNFKVPIYSTLDWLPRSKYVKLRRLQENWSKIRRHMPMHVCMCSPTIVFRVLQNNDPCPWCLTAKVCLTNVSTFRVKWPRPYNVVHQCTSISRSPTCIPGPIILGTCSSSPTNLESPRKAD